MVKYINYTGNSNTILFYLYPFDHQLVAARLVSFALYKPNFTVDAGRSRYASSPTYHPRKDYSSFRKIILPAVKRIKGGKFFSLLAWKADGTIEFQDQSIDTIHNLPDTALEACQSWLKCAELRQTFWSEHVALVGLHRAMCIDQAKKVKSLDDILNLSH